MTVGVKSSENDTRSKLTKLLAQQMAIPLALSTDSYTDVVFHIPKGKPRHGTVIGCRICGATWKTLYKDGDQRICVDCKKKIKEENNK